MIDVSANNLLTKSLEDSLVRLFKTSPAEVSTFDLADIQLLINRIAPNKKCMGVYFDNAKYKKISVIPTYDEMVSIGSYLFNLKEKSYNYSPNNYVISISPEMEYSSIKEVVALILAGIDKISCPIYFNNIKAMLLDKAIEDNMIAGDNGYVFKNGTTYNNACTPFLIPFISSVFEDGKNYFNKKKLLNYVFSTEMETKEDNLLVQYGYLSDLPIEYDEEANQKEKMFFNRLFNDMWSTMRMYPDNKEKTIMLYKQVYENPTSGNFEKELALKSINELKKLNGSIFDKQGFETLMSESVKSFREIRKKGYSELELDELRVELEANTEFSEDKMYLVTRIHKDLATAMRVKKKASDSEKEFIDDFIVQLREILKQTQAKKIRTDNERFRVIVQYPKGDYEE